MALRMVPKESSLRNNSPSLDVVEGRKKGYSRIFNNLILNLMVFLN
jgi:hypothetical protein